MSNRHLLLSAALLLALATRVFAGAGDLDLTFAGTGKVSTRFDVYDDGAQGSALQPDGRILAFGYTANIDYTIADVALTRYARDGSLDATFGTGGRVTTSFLHPYSAAFDGAVLPDGKIVIVGATGDNPGVCGNTCGSGESGDFGNWDTALARYNPDGSLDATFGDGGTVVTDYQSQPQDALAMDLQPDGKILTCGWVMDSPGAFTSQDFFLTRYHPNGTVDTSFGDEGFVRTDVGLEHLGDNCRSVKALPGGKILAAGWAVLQRAPAANTDFALARYNSDGSLDASFGNGGHILIDFYGGDDALVGDSILVQADGRIVVNGWAWSGTSFDLAVARVHADGSLEESFGVGGKSVLDLHFNEGFHSAALQPDGKIIATGWTRVSNGLGVAHPLQRPPAQAAAIALASEGKAASGAINDDWVVARFDRYGNLDPSFGTGGYTTIDFNGLIEWEWVSMVLQPTGNVVVASSTQVNELGDWDFGLARLMGDNATARVAALHARYREVPPGGYQVGFLVIVRENQNLPVAGAKVSADLMLPDGDVIPLTGTTGPNGRALFRSKTSLAGQYRLCVTDISAPGYAYDPGENDRTCARVLIEGEVLPTALARSRLPPVSVPDTLPHR